MFLCRVGGANGHGACSIGRGLDHEQDPERDQQQHDRDRRGALVLPLSICPKMKTDETSVSKGMLPEIRTSEPNSPIARAKASARAGEDRRGEVRQHDAAEDRQRPGAERRRGLLHLGVELEQHRLHRADHERQGHEQQRHHDADARERDAEIPSRLLSP